MVNPGAEVIADGHIHVYAPLRGRAIAGARGNTEARIFALCLEPELISIAGVYRTSEVPLPADVRGKPTQVRLVGGAEGKLVIGSRVRSASRMKRQPSKGHRNGKNHRRDLRQGRRRQDHHQRQLRHRAGPARATRPP